MRVDKLLSKFVAVIIVSAFYLIEIYAYDVLHMMLQVKNMSCDTSFFHFRLSRVVMLGKKSSEDEICELVHPYISTLDELRLAAESATSTTKGELKKGRERELPTLRKAKKIETL